MTALTFNQDAVRLATDAVLESLSNIQVYYGSVTDADNNAKTIGAPLPYLLRGLVMPFDTNLRVGGRGSVVHQFTLQYVHSNDGACLDVAGTVRAFLEGQPVSADGREYRIRLADPIAPITVLRDETWTRPDGGPLFYASDRYNVL